MHWPRRLMLPLIPFVLVACGAVSGEPATSGNMLDAPRAAATFAFRPDTPTALATASPTARRTPPPVTVTPTPTPTATATAAPVATAPPQPVEIARGAALILGDAVSVRSAPSTRDGTVVARLANLQEVQVLSAVKGERWIVGDQDWPMAYQSWTDTWYQVSGGYVYSAFVFMPRAGEASPFPRGGERRIDVEIATQTLRAWVGEQVVFTAEVTTGKPGYDTPKGRYTVGGGGRVANETMTSGQAAINDPAESYHVKNVLFTQYFNNLGDALHLNYWQPEGVFGSTRTSHGCVGLAIHDAQWLWLFTSGGVRLEIR